MTTRTNDRRQFISRTALAAAALATPSLLHAATHPALPGIAPDDRWLATLRGKHRMIFDMPVPAGGLPIIHVRNFVDTYKTAYDLAAPDVNTVVGLYYLTTALAFTDAMWAKYQLGGVAQVTDSETGKPAVRNVLWKPRDGMQTLPIAGGPVAPPNDASMTALQARGVVFILCNNALNFWANAIATASKQEAAAVREELVAHLVPGVEIVPAMVIAIQQAQARGASYMFLP